MRKELEYVHDLAPKQLVVPPQGIAVINGHLHPWRDRQPNLEPLTITIQCEDVVAILQPGDAVTVDQRTGAVHQGDPVYDRRLLTNDGGVEQWSDIGRFASDSEWGECWIDPDGRPITWPPHPPTTKRLGYLHDHAARGVLLPEGHYLITQHGCFHPQIRPDPMIATLLPKRYWKDGAPEDEAAYFGERAVVLTPGDEVIVRHDRDAVIWTNVHTYKEERIRNVEGRIIRETLVQFPVRSMLLEMFHASPPTSR